MCKYIWKNLTTYTCITSKYISTHLISYNACTSPTDNFQFLLFLSTCFHYRLFSFCLGNCYTYITFLNSFLYSLFLLPIPASTDPLPIWGKKVHLFLLFIFYFVHYLHLSFSHKRNHVLFKVVYLIYSLNTVVSRYTNFPINDSNLLCCIAVLHQI